jgi:glycerophosphoryl diester phosphodiesterase
MKIDNGSAMRTIKSFFSVTPMVLTGIVFATTTATANTATPASDSQTQAKAAHKPFVIAHRGGKRWAPENSLSAFKKSLEAGVDGIELDIHKCKSGELVVIHDDTLNRTTNGTGYVKDATWQELSQLDSGSWYSPAFKGEKLPLLQDVFDLIKGKILINVEIKNCPINYSGIEDDLLKMLESYPYPDKIIISSFDHTVLERIHKKTKRYRLALLGDSVMFNLADYAHGVGAAAWNPDFDCVRKDTVKAAHDAGLSVNTWTVNGPENWKKAVDLQVDSIITDDPEGLMSNLHSAN